MGNSTTDLIRTTIVNPLLTELLQVKSDAEAANVVARIQRAIVHGKLREVVYVFVYESWDAVSSILRTAESQFNLQEFSQLPYPLQRTISSIGWVWGDLFRTFPYDTSMAYFQIAIKSDEIARKRLFWLSLPISKYLGRDVMEIVREQLPPNKKSEFAEINSVSVSNSISVSKNRQFNRAWLMIIPVFIALFIVFLISPWKNLNATPSNIEEPTSQRKSLNATVRSEIPTSQPTASPTTITAHLEDSDWQGGYRRSGESSIYGGRTATWIYGTSTQYSIMQTTLELTAQPIGTVSLNIEGMNSEGSLKTPISIQINGSEIYNGLNLLPSDNVPLESVLTDGNWGAYAWSFDATLLHPGSNKISINNLTSGDFGLPPWFMLDYADITYTVSGH